MRFNWLKTLAFALLLIGVGCRCLMKEILREPPAVAGVEAAPTDPAGGIRIVLDILICIPALLVMLHRVANPNSRIKLPGFVLLLSLLAGWAMVSTAWASDRYAALVTSIDALAAAAVLFAGIQCIDSAKRTRWLAGLVAGLFLALVVHGMNKRLIDYPVTLEQWNNKESPYSRWAYMKNNNLSESDFKFRQMEVRIQSGEVMGFSSSPNGYAALVAVGLVVVFGVMRDHYSAGRKGLAYLGFLAIPLAGFVLRYTYSKQGVITPVLGLMGLIGAGWMAKQYKRVFWCGLIGFLVLAICGIGYGMTHGGLPGASLTVRWYYAAGGWKIFLGHVWTGVGWSNFGRYYPVVRGFLATEQVQDPHNILIRGLSELGILGAVLMAGGFGFGAWKIFKPVKTKPEPGAGKWLTWGIVGVVVGLGLNFILSEDFGQNSEDLEYRALGTLGLGLALLAGMGWVMGNGEQEQTPWIHRGLAAGLGIFFIHNLLDFSWSEPGPLCLAALMAGGLVGSKWPVQPTPSSAEERRPRSSDRVLAWGALGAIGVAWAAMGVIGVMAVVAEQMSGEGDGKMARGYVLAAAERYAQAFEWMPMNGDYAYKEALAWMVGGQYLKAKGALDKAIGADGRATVYYVNRANARMQMGDKEGATGDYGMAARLDPMDLELGMDYARTLEWAGKAGEAKREYQRVLEIDGKLPAGEVRRLSEEARKKAMEGVG